MEEKQEKEPPSVALSGERLNEFYKARSVELTQSLIDAFSTSQETRGIPSGEGGRQFWASVLFARICGFGSAMHSLMPETPANKLGAIYDFAPIATICRSLFEAYIAFKYLCEPALSMNEYLLRLHGMQLHDCTRRPDILTKITGN